MAGLEKTWAGRVSLGMKVVMIEVGVVVEIVVDVCVCFDFIIYSMLRFKHGLTMIS